MTAWLPAGALESSIPAASDRFARFVLFPRQVPPGYGFVPLPDDFDLRQNTRNDPAVDRYLRLPANRRDRDLFLYRDLFWLSEFPLKMCDTASILVSRTFAAQKRRAR